MVRVSTSEHKTALKEAAAESALQDILSPKEIIDPFGEVIDAENADDLITAFERLDRLNRQLYDCVETIRRRLGAMTTGETKTRRVAGERRVAKVEMADDKYDGTELKKLWHEFPDYRETYLRISVVDVQVREVKKLSAMATTSKVFLTFKNRLLGAWKKGTAAPRITVEQ